MGTYTELNFRADLRKNTPDDVMAILRYICGSGDRPATLPEHSFFKAPRWDIVGHGCSAYFPGNAMSAVGSEYDDHCIVIRANLKNYDNEIPLFLAWIADWIDEIGPKFLGYMVSDYNDEPDLIYWLNGKFALLPIRIEADLVDPDQEWIDLGLMEPKIPRVETVGFRVRVDRLTRPIRNAAADPE